jgi:hypothetical protein
MHGRIGKQHESGTKHGETDGVAPEGEHVEAEGREDGGAGDLDVDAVLVVDEAQVLDLVDDEALEAEVEDG